MAISVENEKYLYPNKKSPVFVAWCDQFGNMESSMWQYKDWYVLQGDQSASIGSTYAVDYRNAIEQLHDFIEREMDWILEHSKIEFQIKEIDGSLDKYGETKATPIYKLNLNQIKKYFTE